MTPSIVAGYIGELRSMVGRALVENTEDECCAAITEMAGKLVGALSDQCARTEALVAIARIAEATRDGLDSLGIF